MDVGHTSAEEDERWAQILKDHKDLKLKFIMDDGQVERWHHRLVVEGHTHTNLIDGHHRLLAAKELEAEGIGKVLVHFVIPYVQKPREVSKPVSDPEDSMPPLTSESDEDNAGPVLGT